jgi:hypothetical protein
MYPYPVEVISETYLSKLRGFSESLSEREIGINARALLENTSVIIGETTAKLRFLDIREKPYFMKRSYRIVGLEEELSPNGEVVMCEKEEEKFGEMIGKDVLINTVESFRIDGDFSEVVKAFIKYRRDI